MDTKKYLSYDKLQEYDALIKTEIDKGDESTLSNSKSYTDTKVASLDVYSKSEVDTKISGVNTSITNITSGNTVVKEAEHATNADSAITADSATSAGSATKATQDASGNVITDTYETKAESQTKLDTAKEYTNTKTANLASTTVVDNKINTHNTSTSAHSDIRELITDITTKLNNFLNVDDTTTDQLSEVLQLIENNKGTLESLTTSKINVSDIIDNLTTASTDKVLSAKQGVAIKELIDGLQGELDSHGHSISDVTNLQSALNEKATQTALDTHDSNTTKHITSTERTNWNAAKTHADSAHAPSDAEKNQNAFSNIAVSGQTTVAADTATDTITFAGSNVSITTDVNNDKITFSVSDSSTSTRGVVQLTDSTSSTSTTTAATPNSVKSAYDLANTAKTNAGTAQTRADAAYSLAESKVDSLSDLNITATATELNYMDGVTSGVQAQLDAKMGSVTVSASDNGKFLRVVNGAWAAATVPNAEEASF